MPSWDPNAERAALADDDRQALMRAMYRNDPDEEVEPYQPPQRVPPIAAGPNRRTRRLVMGAVSYEVPTVEWVETMERQVQSAHRLIEEQSRAIRRLEATLASVQTQARRQAVSQHELTRQVNHKIDRRD